MEKTLLGFEDNLSKASLYPIIGTLPGIAKIIMGLLQAGLALLLSTLSAPFALGSKNAHAFSSRSATHIVHGAGNILAGLLEAIPLLGTYFSYYRFEKHKNIEDRTADCKDGHYTAPSNPLSPDLKLCYQSVQPHKFLAYATLLPDDRVEITRLREMRLCQQCDPLRMSISHYSSHVSPTYYLDIPPEVLSFVNKPYWLAV